MNKRVAVLSMFAAVGLSTASGAAAQQRTIEPDLARLAEGQGLQVFNRHVTSFSDSAKKGIRLSENLDAGVAYLPGVEFANGVIEAEIAGAPSPGAPVPGFVGIAFRLQNGTYDAFYLRPTNGRAEDQERRNHATQYVSHPDWPWFRLRKEFPSKYESYVDLVPDVWTKIKIEVRGERARLYVHGQEQPTLIVNDLKSGAQGKGGVALWIDQGTVAYFRNLTVKLEPDGKKSPPVR